jgi:hypothetical protein
MEESDHGGEKTFSILALRRGACGERQCRRRKAGVVWQVVRSFLAHTFIRQAACISQDSQALLLLSRSRSDQTQVTSRLGLMQQT